MLKFNEHISKHNIFSFCELLRTISIEKLLKLLMIEAFHHSLTYLYTNITLTTHFLRAQTPSLLFPTPLREYAPW